MTELFDPRPTLSAGRTRLRPLDPRDAPRFARLANDFEVVKMTGGMPFPYGLANAEGFIARAEAADPDREIHFAIDLPGEGVIGVIGFYPHESPGPEIGYWLGRPYWGRGYITEALKVIMAWARDAWARRCITACHFIDNPASGSALVRAGFLYTGVVEPLSCRARGELVPARWMIWLA